MHLTIGQAPAAAGDVCAVYVSGHCLHNHKSDDGHVYRVSKMKTSQKRTMLQMEMTLVVINIMYT